MRGSSAVERPVVTRCRRGFDALPRSQLGVEVLTDAHVASTHEEPGQYRPTLPLSSRSRSSTGQSARVKHGRSVVRRHPGPRFRDDGPSDRRPDPRCRPRASRDGTALIRRDDRVRFPGGLPARGGAGAAQLFHTETAVSSNLTPWTEVACSANEHTTCMVIEVEVVETPGCGPGGREFEPPRSPQGPPGPIRSRQGR